MPPCLLMDLNTGRICLLHILYVSKSRVKNSKYTCTRMQVLSDMILHYVAVLQIRRGNKDNLEIIGHIFPFKPIL